MPRPVGLQAGERGAWERGEARPLQDQGEGLHFLEPRDASLSEPPGERSEPEGAGVTSRRDFMGSGRERCSLGPGHMQPRAGREASPERSVNPWTRGDCASSRTARAASVQPFDELGVGETKRAEDGPGAPTASRRRGGRLAKRVCGSGQTQRVGKRPFYPYSPNTQRRVYRRETQQLREVKGKTHSGPSLLAAGESLCLPQTPSPAASDSHCSCKGRGATGGVPRTGLSAEIMRHSEQALSPARPGLSHGHNPRPWCRVLRRGSDRRLDE